MTKGKFYFLSDEYCEKFYEYGVMANKEETSSGLHRRPCFYSIQDIKDENVFWMIPVSSQIDKYKKILENKLKRYKQYDGLEFGYVQGREAAFLLQNICPVTRKDVVHINIGKNESNRHRLPD